MGSQNRPSRCVNKLASRTPIALVSRSMASWIVPAVQSMMHCVICSVKTQRHMWLTLCQCGQYLKAIWGRLAFAGIKHINRQCLLIILFFLFSFDKLLQLDGFALWMRVHFFMMIYNFKTLPNEWFTKFLTKAMGSMFFFNEITNYKRRNRYIIVVLSFTYV